MNEWMIQGNKQKRLENKLWGALSLSLTFSLAAFARSQRTCTFWAPCITFTLSHSYTHTPLLCRLSDREDRKTVWAKTGFTQQKRKARILSPPKRYPRRRRACLQQQQQRYHHQQHSSLASSVCPSVCGYYCGTVFCLLSSPLCLYCTADTDTHGFCCCCCDVLECMFYFWDLDSFYSFRPSDFTFKPFRSPDWFCCGSHLRLMRIEVEDDEGLDGLPTVMSSRRRRRWLWCPADVIEGESNGKCNAEDGDDSCRC